MLPIYEYNGTLAGNLLENTDVINTLTSGETTKPLSAAQGKVLNDKIKYTNNRFGTITQLVYVKKVLQIPSADAVVQVFTLAELKELLQITGDDSDFYNRITATVINGAKNTNKGNIIACNYEEQNKLMIIKTQSADVGGMQCNFLIAYAGGIEG